MDWLIDWLVVSAWVGEWVSKRAIEGGREREREAGAEGGRGGGREVGWYTDAKNAHFINVRLSLGRVLTTQFDWFDVFLCLNYVNCVSNGQLSTVINHFDLVRGPPLNIITFHYIMPVRAFTMRSYWGQIMVCRLDPTSVCLLCGQMFHTAKYAITFLIFVHFDTSEIQIRKGKVSNPPWKSCFVTYIDVSVNLEISSLIHSVVSYSSPKHYDILLTISHHPIFNMDCIRSSIRFVRIHMCLL